MKRKHRLRLFIILSVAMVVAGSLSATLPASAHAVGALLANETAVAVDRAVRAWIAGPLARNRGSAPLTLSSGPAFLTPTEIYALSRAAVVPPLRRTADSSLTAARCVPGPDCEGTRDSTSVRAAPDIVRDAQLRSKFRLAAVGLAAAGGFVAMDEIASLTSGSDNPRPARWFLALGHVGDTTIAGLALRGPRVAHDDPVSPLHPEPCYTTAACTMPAVPNGDPEHADRGGSNNPGDRDQDGPHDGDPNKPPVIVTTATPEPSTVILLATGLALVALVQLRRRRPALDTQ